MITIKHNKRIRNKKPGLQDKKGICYFFAPQFSTKEHECSQYLSLHAFLDFP